MRAPTQPLTEQLVPNALLQTLLDASQTGIVHLRPLYAAERPAEVIDLAYVRLNPAAQRLLGLPEFPVGTLLTLAPQDAALVAFYSAAFASEQAEYYDYQPTPLGERLYVAAQRDGELLVASLTAVPAPAADPALVLPPTLAQQILGQTVTAVCVVQSPEYRLSYANLAFEKLFPGRQLVGSTVAEALPEVPQPNLELLLRHLGQTGGSFFGPDVRLNLPPVDGRPTQWGYFNFRYQAYQASGQPSYISISAHDVTRQVLARQQREQQRAEWQRLFEQAPVAMAVLRGPEHLIELVNPAMCALWDRSAEQVLELPLFEALPETNEPLTKAILTDVLATGKARTTHERLGPAKATPADKGYWSFGYYPLQESEGQVTGIAVVALDISAQLRDRHQVQELNAELSTLNEELLTANEELHANNTELEQAQMELWQLNRNLETRVLEGVRAARAARDEAERQRRRLANFFQQVPAAICVLDGPTMVYELVNTDYQRLLPGRTMLGRPLLEALPELANSLIWQTLQQVYQTGEPHEEIGVRVPLARHEGGPLEDFYLHYVQQARYDEHGQIDGVLMFMLNITEQIEAHRRAEKLQAEILATIQRRAQERETFYQVFEQTSALVALMWGPEHRFEYVNHSFQQLFAGRHLHHRPLAEALPELVAQGVPNLLDRVYSTGEPYHGTELPFSIIEPDGHSRKTVYFNFTYQAYLEEGQPRGIAVFAYDVTEQVSARQAVVASAQQAQDLAHSLLVANEQLTRTNTDLDNFIYTASHDLKAPIANIEGLLLLLRKQLPTEARQAGLVPRVLTMMQGAIERFQLTIAQLTDLAKLQHAYTQPAEEVDLPAVVEAVRLDLAPLLEETHAELLVNLDGCATVSFAPQHLRSIVYNLLSNALKYRHPDRTPVVQLRCHHQGPAAVLEVQDNGLGLTPEQQRKLFAMFRRLHDHVAGSGVGLYMVKRMIENAGGSITVQSEPDVGSTFTVTFPT
ncbi:PAS domain-containing protein [Hymenobacter setariae]|nr:PAS domain-containing protein [Hymenobacter setariae]